MFEFDGKTVLVTGASAGIGRDIARQLGSKAGKLILVARRKDRLDELAGELTCETQVLPCDLANPSGVDDLMNALGDSRVDVLVNNAGFGLMGRFHEQEEPRLQQMIQLNIVALADLTRRLVPPMVERDCGVVLNVGSVAGFQPVPGFGLYAATKAFVNSFSEALWWELQDTSVRVGVLCPGTTTTEFFDVAEAGSRRVGYTQTSEAVAAVGIDMMREGQALRISGFPNWLVIFAQRFFPRSFVQWVTARFFSSVGPSKSA